ncbi:hypothetical protein M3172_13440 [Mesobacillus subterraneus]|uniref:hypothetical protein n=1 Tax=Mesobacillus subterraneus TaxID=285983 RepID=UPI00203F1FF1|nr:hypothetical protein [Mesobacillus subterraneus]MCM3574193.1 hypothetical protein [Mesobacillus subterraneus]
MRKIITFFAAMCLVMSMFSGIAGAKTNKEKTNLHLHSKGIMEVVDTNFHTISETETEQVAEVTETDGQDAKGNFRVDLTGFEGVIDTDTESYELEGLRVVEEEGLLYKGNVKNKEGNVKFEALLIQDVDHKNKYKSIINILTFENGTDEEPMDVITFSFNNKEKTVTKKTVVLPKKKVKVNSGGISIASDYYEYLSAYYGTYMETLVAGPKRVKVDAGSNYSVRSTTKSSKISSYWKSQGYSVYGTKLAEWDVDFTGVSYSVYNAVDPVSSKETSYTAPIYIPGYIGTQLIPVTLSKITVSNSGTKSLAYDFSWGYEGIGGYVDDSGVSSKPTKGHIVRAFWDTTYNISKGWKWNGVKSSYLYRTRVITLTSGGFFYVTKRATTSFTYGVEVI